MSTVKFSPPGGCHRANAKWLAAGAGEARAVAAAGLDVAAPRAGWDSGDTLPRRAGLDFIRTTQQ